MEKAMQIGKTSATGSFQLLIGVAVSTVIMAIGSIILGRFLTTDEYGLYGIVLIPVTLINLFRDWGINSAMTKYIASLRGSHRDEEIPNVIIAGLIFEVASGLTLSFLSLALASFIASTIFQRPESASFIAIVSVSIISGSLLAASQAIFIGYERMDLNSFTLICQAVVRTAIGPALVFLGYSVLGAVIGYCLGFMASGIIGVATFYLVLFRPMKRRLTSKSSITKTLKTMLGYGVPLSMSSILSGILAQVYAFMVVPMTTNTLYGNYATAFNFTVLLTFLTVPITTVLFPAFAKLDANNENELVRIVYSSSIKYTSLLLIPATMTMMVLSGPMIGTLYGEKYVYGPFFLTISVIGNLLALVGNLSAGGLLVGLGETRMIMMQGIVTLIVGLPLGILLVSMFEILGLIIAGIFAGLPSTFWGLYWIWKHYKAKPDLQSSGKILAASTIASLAAYLPTYFLDTTNWIKLTIGLTVAFVVYLLGAPLIGAVSSTDINNLRTMFSGLGVISKIINLPLAIAEQAARAKIMRGKSQSP